MGPECSDQCPSEKRRSQVRTEAEAGEKSPRERLSHWRLERAGEVSPES